MSRRLHIAFDPIYQHPLPEGHRFPMLKYELIPEQMLYEGLITGEHFFAPSPCADETVLLTHTAAYLDKLKNQTLSPQEQRRIGFPQSPELTLRELIITQGTIDCCHHALENGVALNIAGGTHHAFADRGEGFCLLNDFGVAGNYLLHKNLVKKILIIDLDVHQGNGTASIFQNEPGVFTFSMHGKNNYPFIKEKSNLDVELPDGIGDEAYLDLLHQHLPRLVTEVRPDIAFFVSGVDILETDKFGKLRITLRGCRLRDEFVFSTLRHHNIPCIAAMGGGYSPDVKMIVQAHCNTFRAAKEIYELIRFIFLN
ncbi:MAG TPA: histone deacetylase [Flavisolibacter sp.]|jgi:acetoin utilization deacetylase AcuC-like enzyme